MYNHAGTKLAASLDEYLAFNAPKKFLWIMPFRPGERLLIVTDVGNVITTVPAGVGPCDSWRVRLPPHATTAVVHNGRFGCLFPVLSAGDAFSAIAGSVL